MSLSKPEDPSAIGESPEPARAFMDRAKPLVDRHLDRFLPPVQQRPQIVHEAIRYSVFAGGKRLRPCLTLAVGEALGGSLDSLIRLACALEMIHTFSLIHDDLPAMDDDDFRRGKPTLHRRFDEATAVLAGDALMNLAFETLARDDQTDPSIVLRLIRILCRATGSVEGMIGGQVADIEAEGKANDEETLLFIHRSKTGSLIAASVEGAAVICGADEKQRDGLRRFGQCVGLAFQIVDDILDVEGSSVELGKKVGQDQHLQKATYPGLHGLEASRQAAIELVEEAGAAIEFLGERGRILRDLARFVSVRRS